MIAITAATAGSDYQHVRLHPAPRKCRSHSGPRQLFAALTRSPARKPGGAAERGRANYKWLGSRDIAQ